MAAVFQRRSSKLTNDHPHCDPLGQVSYPSSPNHATQQLASAGVDSAAAGTAAAATSKGTTFSLTTAPKPTSPLASPTSPFRLGVGPPASPISGPASSAVKSPTMIALVPRPPSRLLTASQPVGADFERMARLSQPQDSAVPTAAAAGDSTRSPIPPTSPARGRLRRCITEDLATLGQAVSPTAATAPNRATSVGSEQRRYGTSTLHFPASDVEEGPGSGRSGDQVRAPLP